MYEISLSPSPLIVYTEILNEMSVLSSAKWHTSFKQLFALFKPHFAYLVIYFDVNTSWCNCRKMNHNGTVIDTSNQIERNDCSKTQSNTARNHSTVKLCANFISIYLFYLKCQLRCSLNIFLCYYYVRLRKLGTVLAVTYFIWAMQMMRFFEE